MRKSRKGWLRWLPLPLLMQARVVVVAVVAAVVERRAVATMLLVLCVCVFVLVGWKTALFPRTHTRLK